MGIEGAKFVTKTLCDKFDKETEDQLAFVIEEYVHENKELESPEDVIRSFVADGHNEKLVRKIVDTIADRSERNCFEKEGEDADHHMFGQFATEFTHDDLQLRHNAAIENAQQASFNVCEVKDMGWGLRLQLPDFVCLISMYEELYPDGCTSQKEYRQILS